MIRAVIVDDEPLARERLRSLVSSESDVHIVAEYCDGDSAVGGIEADRPDLVFLDVQMPEMDGFDVLHALDVQPPVVVFVTAYDMHALRAFEVAALDYLLKPIDEDRFRIALDRARARLASGEPSATVAAAVVEQLRRRSAEPQRFVVRTGSRVTLVRSNEVEWIEAAGNYAQIHAEGRTQLVRETMKSIESRLDPAEFVRIHRSVIVRVDRIAAMEPYFHGEWTVTMKGGRKFTSSRTHSPALRALMR